MANPAVFRDARAGTREGHRETPYLVLALTALVSLWLLQLALLGGPKFGIDDAYIYGHNADVLLSGADPNYGVSPLYGTTSAPFLLLLTALRSAFPLLWALELACLLGALFYFAAVWRLARGLPVAWRAVALASALLTARTIHQVTNGLETGWAMAAVMWAIVGMVERNRWMGLLTGLMPGIRPDLLPLAAFIWLTSEHRTRHIALAVTSFAPFAIWYAIETGVPFPLTAEAKRIYFNEASWPLSQKLSVGGMGLGVWLLEMSPAAVGFLLLPRRLAICAAGSAATLLAAGISQLPSSLYMYDGRYFYPLAPFAVAGLVLSGRRLVLAVSAVVGLALTPIWWNDHLDVRNYADRHLAPIAQWVNGNLPPQSRLLVHDAGYIAAFTSFRMTDVVGLKSPAVIPIHRKLTAHGDRADAISEIARGHDYLVVLGSWESAINAPLKAKGWRLTEVGPPGIFRVYELAPPAAPVSTAGSSP